MLPSHKCGTWLRICPVCRISPARLCRIPSNHPLYLLHSRSEAGAFVFGIVQVSRRAHRAFYSPVAEPRMRAVLSAAHAYVLVVKQYGNLARVGFPDVEGKNSASLVVRRPDYAYRAFQLFCNDPV